MVKSRYILQVMADIKNWADVPFEEVVAEYERRKASRSLQDIYDALGLTKQGFFYRLDQHYKAEAKKEEERKSA